MKKIPCEPQYARKNRYYVIIKQGSLRTVAEHTR